MMKNVVAKVVAVGLVVSCLSGVPADAKAGLKVSKGIVKVGKTVTVKVVGSKTASKWKVSGKHVKVVSKTKKVLKLKGVSAGKCTVKAKAGKKWLKATLTVKNAKKTDIKPSPTLKPSEKPKPEETIEPLETDEPEETDAPEETDDPENPIDTPEPLETPDPYETPEPEEPDETQEPIETVKPAVTYDKLDKLLDSDDVVEQDDVTGRLIETKWQSIIVLHNDGDKSVSVEGNVVVIDKDHKTEDGKPVTEYIYSDTVGCLKPKGYAVLQFEKTDDMEGHELLLRVNDTGVRDISENLNYSLRSSEGIIKASFSLVDECNTPASVLQAVAVLYNKDGGIVGASYFDVGSLKLSQIKVGSAYIPLNDDGSDISFDSMDLVINEVN